MIEKKVDVAYRAELRKRMTLNKEAGYFYYKSAKDKGVSSVVSDFVIVTRKSKEVVNISGEGANEALILYNEYFKDTEYTWTNPTTWGAEDWDENEDWLIKFAFETAMTAGIGFGSGAAGKAVGQGVLKALARRGLSQAAVATIKEGGITAFKAAIKRESKGLLKAYIKTQMASIAVEGAVMFTVGVRALGGLAGISRKGKTYLTEEFKKNVSDAASKTVRVVGEMGEYETKLSKREGIIIK